MSDVGSDPHDRIETDIEESTPNAAGPERAEGDMGISSERPGSDLSGIEGTGSTGDSVTATTGTGDLSPHEVEPVDPAQRPRRDGVDEEPEPVPDNDVPPHEFDPAKNPGHSHG